MSIGQKIICILVVLFALIMIYLFIAHPYLMTFIAIIFH